MSVPLNNKDIVKVVNVVVSGRLNQRIHLHEFAQKCQDFSFEPEIYCGGHLLLNSNVITIYDSGNYIIPGIKSLPAIEDVWDEFSSYMAKYFDKSLFEKPHIGNIVALITLPNPIDLRELYKKNIKENVRYDPDIFPALVWKFNVGTALFFRTGKIILTGLKSEEMLNDLADIVLEKFKIEA